MAGAMFDIMARDSVCRPYYTYNTRLDYIGDYLWFPLPPKNLDTLRYIGLDNFASRLGAY